MISRAIHTAQRVKVPMKMAERIVRASGGVYTEDMDMIVMLPKNQSCVNQEAAHIIAPEQNTISVISISMVDQNDCDD
jgi:hypothetical protein